MNPRSHPFLLLAAALLAPTLLAKPVVTVESANSSFRFKEIPLPASNDAATGAGFEIIDGERDRNGADTAVLHDGLLPGSNDQPGSNFFYRSDGGRLRIDLGEVIQVESIASYSCHADTRAPQVYDVYGADGRAPGFDPKPARGTPPAKAGWEPIARVDTRGAKKNPQHAALITPAGSTSLGRYRYLLFDVSRTSDTAAFSNTFFSEIDVFNARGPKPERNQPAEPVIETFTTDDRKYTFTIDATKAPDLMPWVKKELVPVVREWYPKMVEMLPGKRFKAPEEVTMEFKDDMGGTPAYAAGNALSLSIPFFRSQLEGEARGCVIHELVHVIQNYGIARTYTDDPAPVPGWITEGIPDYIRWFIYEPETRGAELNERNIGNARYDGSYRISANFIDWVSREYDPQLASKLNAAAREGRYSEKLWKDWTEHPLEELGELWLKAKRKDLGIGDR